MYRFFANIILSFLFYYPVCAQTSARIEHISTETVLSQDTVCDIPGYPDGMLWQSAQNEFNRNDSCSINDHFRRTTFMTGHKNPGPEIHSFPKPTAKSRYPLHISLAAFSLNIPPSFWTSAWFLIIVSSLLVLLLYIVHRVRIKTIETHRKILKHQVEKRTRELKKINEELKLAKAETDNILQNAEEGFFLVNKALFIGTQYSRSLESMMGTSDLAGCPLIQCLANYVCSETLTSTKEYLELMFNDDIDEDVLQELNPISMIEMNFNGSAEETPSSKFLSFQFKRIRNNQNAIIDLFATVHDITDQTNLARELQKTELDQKHKMELLFSILHVEPAMFSEFMESAEEELHHIKSSLHRPLSEQMLERLYRSAHSIKGNAALLDLRTLLELSHHFEDKLIEIQKAGNQTESATHSLQESFNNLYESFAELKGLINQISNFQANFRPKRRYENKLLLQSLENLIKSTAEELNKKVAFDYKEFDPGKIPYNHRLLIKEVLIQLFRNAISHGIELPDERKRKGKPVTGTITLSSTLDKSSFRLQVHDDGGGIKSEKLKEKLINTGKWTREEIEKWTDKELQMSIFYPGISTQDSSNFISGRGIGMDIIKNRLSKANGGIEITQKAGHYCAFTVTLPLMEKEK